MSATVKSVESQTADSRKPYTKPQLISYGHVKDIVQGSGGAMGDGGGNMSRMCWVADAIYGESSPRTTLLRAWLTRAYDERRRWWLLISVYRVCGRTVAGLIRRGHFPRRLFVPLFDYLLIQANDDTVRMFR
ncbi:MAG: hypothetical protein WBD07_04415 [Vicinamibacterales bacterium]